ncbi:DUF2235 domain-containing protein [Thiohalophilus sp.]|uniref:DUF2235 domain-containing protein n=1 Tax=Thiohalophilus sp. TaxID=3028392 RepID=UPI002ACE8D22|nr:DUF2235 domain-containing protein [Thiohalophilus sp.]MDZ7660836.1 DUF2235 domain-containing protein [Thiohalophilus sp.]
MGKTLFICTDGTWNTADQKDDGVISPSNVAKMARIILSTPKQLTWYDEGVGTRNWLDKLTGGAFGHGLFENIQEAYRFVVEHYQPGDRLVLFGFSRGAYTARSLAGLIGKFGVLRKKYISKIEQTYEMYRNHDTDLEKIEAYRERYSHVDRDVHFLGVWDTVGALGVPLKSLNWTTSWLYKFHDTKLSPHVKHAFHAVAVDEKRRTFTPTLWLADNLCEDQVVEQRWFAGVHSNIGGSYKEKGLSDITLRWMLDRLKEVLPEVQLDEVYIARTVLPDYTDTLRESRSCLYISSWIRPHIRDTRRAHICNQVIDDSVYQRIDCDQCDYQPKNIVRN